MEEKTGEPDCGSRNLRSYRTRRVVRYVGRPFQGVEITGFCGDDGLKRPSCELALSLKALSHSRSAGVRRDHSKRVQILRGSSQRNIDGQVQQSARAPIWIALLL